MKKYKTYLYTSPSLPLAVTKSPQAEKVTALALPFIFKSATHIFDFASTIMMYPSFPMNAMRLPSGEVVNLSRDFSFLP